MAAATAPTIIKSDPGLTTLATGGVLPDPTADRVLGQWAFTNNGYGTSSSLMWLPAGVAISPPGAPNAGRIFVVEYGYSDTTGNYGNHRVLSWPSAHSFVTDQSADLVIGQTDFITRGGGTAQDRFFGPEAAVVDASGNLWVADTVNNRVLRFNYPLSDGMDASVVLGQPDYVSGGSNRGGNVAANALFFPRGLAMDSAGNLYVADDFNHRVLRFSPPFTEFGMSASLVIGQEDYTHNDPNRNGDPGRNTLNYPKGLAADAAGNLYIADYENNRVLRFAPPFSDGMDASQVFGQPDYSHNGPNRDEDNPGANTLYHPVDLAVSAAGDALFITDQGNVRLLGYSDPVGDAAGAAVADEVYGQSDFNVIPPDTGASQTVIGAVPLGVAVDSNGSLYFADYLNNRLLAFDVEVVGDGQAGSCTETALDAALAGGGTITFDCGVAQIDLSTFKAISVNTVIDGQGRITLSGRNANQLFSVDAAISLDLRNITLTGGSSSGDGGAIYNEGMLTLQNSTIRDSVAAGSGGAIVNYGMLVIQDSLLEGNQALNGGALYPRWGSSSTIIVNSTLRDNHATDTTDGWGGAILSWDGAYVDIQGSDIYSNTAQSGGGIYNFANSILALYNNSRLRNNIAANNGGGLYNAGTVAVTDAAISSNTANDGGGLFNDDGTAYLANVTLNGNSADYGGGIINYAGLELTNATISGNSASSNGGGLDNSGATTFTNVTLSNNSAPSGGGIYNFAGTITLKNSIIANSTQGGNCDGGPLTNDNSDKYSLSSDNTCALAGTGSMNGVDPLLTDLGDYGGLTQVHMLQSGSPAIDGVQGSDAPSTDQRGVARPQGSGYDIGAVEVAPDDLVKKVYLPLAIR